MAGMNSDADIPLLDWALPGEPFRLVAVEVDATDWAARLPAEARKRIGRFTDPRARARAGASEWFKGCWLPRELRLAHVEMTWGSNGKPILAGEAASWGFTLSHTGKYAVAALASGGDVGVDLESITRKADIHRLAQRVFSESEQAWVREGGREAFFVLWSQKEALLKALGCGWADGSIQRRTRLLPVAFHREPATEAEIWSRRILDGAYVLAVALLRR
jgi:phosphopantetheinyl transferase